MKKKTIFWHVQFYCEHVDGECFTSLAWRVITNCQKLVQRRGCCARIFKDKWLTNPLTVLIWIIHPEASKSILRNPNTNFTITFGFEVRKKGSFSKVKVEYD